MPADLEELPLFPLNTVLFPYAQLQLHVFEERNQEMVRMCMEFDRPFGIVLIRESKDGGLHEPYLVGTAVRIMGMHEYTDGRLDIHVAGERRFRVREFDESRPYLVGKVEPVIELEFEESPESEQLVMRAREDCEMLVQRRFEQQGLSVRLAYHPDPVVLSFTIANLLPMETIEKQRLLELTDTVERLRSLLPILAEQLIEMPKTGYTRLTPHELSEWIYPN